VSNFFNKGFT